MPSAHASGLEDALWLRFRSPFPGAVCSRGLIGVQISDNMRAKAFCLGNVGYDIWGDIMSEDAATAWPETRKVVRYSLADSTRIP